MITAVDIKNTHFCAEAINISIIVRCRTRYRLEVATDQFLPEQIYFGHVRLSELSPDYSQFRKHQKVQLIMELAGLPDMIHTTPVRSCPKLPSGCPNLWICSYGHLILFGLAVRLPSLLKTIHLSILMKLCVD